MAERHSELVSERSSVIPNLIRNSLINAGDAESSSAWRMTLNAWRWTLDVGRGMLNTTLALLIW